MIRQARSYFVGALSGTALVAIAVVVFVVLVSAQTLRNWPLSDLGFGGDGGDSVSSSQVEAGAPTGEGSAGGGSAQGAAGGESTGAGGAAGTAPSQQSAIADSGGGLATSPGSTGPNGGSGGDSSPASQPTTGGGVTSGDSGGSTPSKSGGNAPSSVSESVTGAVNDTVAGADRALGGALEESGVTKATEGTVNGLTGPESAAGQTVDGVVGTVDDLLDEDR